jgi:hypothetical protein
MSISLPPMPLIDVPAGEEPALHGMRMEPRRLKTLLDAGYKFYTPAGVRIAEHLTRRWARRLTTPYADVVERTADLAGRPGLFLMNHSYEWGCTTGVGDDSDLGGVTLLRTLDWPLDGLGDSSIVLNCTGKAGRYWSVTWPGYVGVLTACAPGRFAGVINQPPARPTGLGRPGDWLVTRVRMSRRHAIPPTHLLRQAFDQCATFDAAVDMISHTPICIPAIFTLAGTQPGEAVVLERTETGCYRLPRPIAANHWVETPERGRPRNATSHDRRAQMITLIDQNQSYDWSFDWLTAPILRHDTRLAVMANPRTGRMSALGLERHGRATAALNLVA